MPRGDILADPPAESSPLGWAAHGSSNCGNPRGDYVRAVRALLAAGARPAADHAEIASPEVAEILYAALAGESEEAKLSGGSGAHDPVARGIRAAGREMIAAIS